MRHDLKKSLLSLLLVWVMVLTGCGYSLGEKAGMRSYEKQGKKNAIAYIEGKYGFTPKVKDVEADTAGIFTWGSLFPEVDFSPSATGNVTVKMEHEDKVFSVVISGEFSGAEGYDDYQADEIVQGIYAVAEEVIEGKVLDVGFCYGEGKDMYYNINEKGMVNTYYDGTNLREVLEEDLNEIVIHYIGEDSKRITTDMLAESFGSNTDCYLVEYLDEESYHKMERPTKDAFYGLHYGEMSKYALLLDETVKVRAGELTYAQYSPQKWNQLYYLLEDGTYCNIEETTIDATGWSSQWNPVGKAYHIETDTDTIDLWLPVPNVPGSNIKDWEIGIYYYDEREHRDKYEVYESYKSGFMADGYIHTNIYLPVREKEFTVILLEDSIYDVIN